MAADCLAPRHDKPEPAAPAANLCRSCTSRLRSDLRRLPGLHAELAGLLDPRRASGPGTGSGGGLPYHEPASEAMSQIRHDLTFWVRQVIADRKPAAWPLASVPAMCAWLSGYGDWLPLRDWAGDMAGALAADAGRAWAILDPRPVKRFPLPGKCPECGAAGLNATIYQEDDRRRSFVSCSACEHDWESGPQWYRRLGRDILRHGEVAA